MEFENVIVKLNGKVIGKCHPIQYEEDYSGVVFKQIDPDTVQVDHNYTKEEMIEVIKELDKTTNLTITIDGEEISMAQAISMVGKSNINKWTSQY